MKQFNTKHTATTLSTRGFYTILAICGVIIAASAWVLWSSAHRQAETGPLTDSSVVTPAGTMPDLMVESPVVADEPEMTEPASASAEQTDPETGLSAEAPVENDLIDIDPEGADVSAGADAEAPVSTEEPESPPVLVVTAPVYVRPAAGAVITPFSGDELLFQPTFGDWRVHTGTDFAAEAGESVLALTDGTVSDVFDDGLYGTCVSVAHDADLTTTYRGLTDVRVAAGQAVSAGEALGVCAESIAAEDALGTHVHVEAARAGTPVDILEMLSEDELE